MAMRFLESFDHYDTVTKKWDAAFNADIQSGTGRFGDGACLFGNTDHYAQRVIDAQPTWIFGFAWYQNNNNFGDGNHPMISVYDGSTVQCSISPFTSGPFCGWRAHRGTPESSGTLLGTGTALLKQLTWYYIEVLFTINDSTGVIQTKIDGVTDINLTSQDTKVTSNATANMIELGSHNGGGGRSVFITDMYVNDGTGSAPNNTFLGDLRVECTNPNGNGNSSQLVGQDADSTNNYLNVDDGGPASDPDGDTTYNESSTVGNKDTYAYSNLATTSGTVYGIQILPYVRKTDAGARSIASIARHSSTEVDSSNRSLSTTYQYFPDIRETKPGGGVWTITDINNAEFGVKVTA